MVPKQTSVSSFVLVVSISILRPCFCGEQIMDHHNIKLCLDIMFINMSICETSVIAYNTRIAYNRCIVCNNKSCVIQEKKHWL